MSEAGHAPEGVDYYFLVPVTSPLYPGADPLRHHPRGGPSKPQASTHSATFTTSSSGSLWWTGSLASRWTLPKLSRWGAKRHCPSSSTPSGDRSYELSHLPDQSNPHVPNQSVVVDDDDARFGVPDRKYVMRCSYEALGSNFTYRTLGLARPLSSWRLTDFFASAAQAGTESLVCECMGPLGLTTHLTWSCTCDKLHDVGPSSIFSHHACFYFSGLSFYRIGDKT